MGTPIFFGICILDTFQEYLPQPWTMYGCQRVLSWIILRYHFLSFCCCVPGGDGLRGGGDAVLVGAADGEEPLEGQGQHEEDWRAARRRRQGRMMEALSDWLQLHTFAQQPCFSCDCEGCKAQGGWSIVMAKRLPNISKIPLYYSYTCWSKFANSIGETGFLLIFGNLFATTMKLPLLFPCTLGYSLI